MTAASQPAAAAPGPAAASQPVVGVEGVSKAFQRPVGLVERTLGRLGVDIHAPAVHALDDVSLQVMPGEVVGLVGESGCGKSTLGRIIAGITPPTRGTIRIHGQDITRLSPEEQRKVKIRSQMIFQDPFASLNPRKRVRDIIGEAPLVHGLVDRAGLEDYVDTVMLQCGLDPAFKNRYPHQFSGGQRQRVGIARALAVRPEFVVCDESVAALDVSIQAQVLNLFMDLREQLNLTYLFISHDLGVVEHLSDRVVIMYLGRVVESASTDELFAAPNHPYTQALLDEMPVVSTERRTFVPIKGEIPSPMNPPPGCHFHPRCPHAFERCSQERPALREVAPGRLSACHLNDSPA